MAAPEKELGELLADVAAHRRSALERLYGELSPRVFGLLVALLPRRDLAEAELVEVFLDVWAQAGAFDPRVDRPTTWVLRIAVRRAMARVHDRRPAPTFAEILRGIRVDDAR